MTRARIRDTAVRAGTALAGLGAAVALANRLGLRQLRAGTPTVTEPVTICLPARNEAERLPGLIADLRAQQGIPRLRVIILDDASTDGTPAAVNAAIDGDPRFTLARNDIDPPPGWTGKTAACARLADLASTGDDPGIIVFLDADIRLHPEAIAAAVHELRREQAALVCPWPAQLAETVPEALVQPLLAWSWASSLPLAVGNRSTRSSMAVACGQFLVFDAAEYRAIGGHAAVADQVAEDLAIARALRRAGHRTLLVGGGNLARTRMYRSSRELDEGYSRWLWSAYGGVAGSLAVGAVTTLAFWAPPAAMLLGRGRIRRLGAAGYATAVAARLLARSTETGGGLSSADALAALAHPVSIAAYLRLSARSHRAHRTGDLTWKGRAISTVC
ncbi:glycosyltransferase [Nocardia sp. NPDC020380]|uniref:glycosyltransferase n=1 Tax=Nocardia sp. NPDC020380 TaxID=3364309 RepID=UPI0037957A8E